MICIVIELADSGLDQFSAINTDLVSRSVSKRMIVRFHAVFALRSGIFSSKGSIISSNLGRRRSRKRLLVAWQTRDVWQGEIQ
jgi:hypothetical protein